MPSVPTVTSRQLNRSLLARQMLLQRVDLPLSRVVERMGGIQAQYAPSAYIGLWSRREGFERPHLTAALEQRRVVQGTLMRSTIHIVSRRDYWPLAAGIRRARRDWWLRAAPSRGAGGVDQEALAGHLRTALAGGEIGRAALLASLEAAGFPRQAWEGAGAWIEMVRVPPSGTWERRRADRYADAASWVGPDTATEAEGRDRLLRRYLAAFGPATIAEAASWAGVPAEHLQEAAARMRLRRLLDPAGAELVDLPRAPLPAADTPAPVRFIGTWEAMLLAHARRAAVLPEEYRPLVFHTKNPQSVNTFLVEGAVAGSWRHEAGRVVTEPFAPLPRRARRDVEAEAGRLAAFLA